MWPHSTAVLPTMRTARMTSCLNLTGRAASQAATSPVRISLSGMSPNSRSGRTSLHLSERTVAGARIASQRRMKFSENSRSVSGSGCGGPAFELGANCYLPPRPRLGLRAEPALESAPPVDAVPADADAVLCGLVGRAA